MAGTVMDRLKEIEGRQGKLEARLRELTDREREVGLEIGAKVAAGKDAVKLRDERREIREQIEDITAALPHITREIEALEVEMKAEARLALAGRVSAVEGEAARIGARIRELMAPVAVELAKIPALDTRYREAQRAHLGRGDTPAAEPMGIALDTLRTLDRVALEVAR